MWKFTVTFVMALSLFVLFPMATNAQIEESLQQKLDQMVYPTVSVRIGDFSGSGTIVYSNPNGIELEKGTFILSAHHIFDEYIANAAKGADKGTIHVSTLKFDSTFRILGREEHFADIVAMHKPSDLVLLKLRNMEIQMPHVAHLAPLGLALPPFKPVWALGSALGELVFPTAGYIAHQDAEAWGRRNILTSMFVDIGISGGGLFHLNMTRGYELLGVVVGFRNRNFSVSIPPETIRIFLDRTKHTFIK